MKISATPSASVYLEYSEGSSNKFYRLKNNGSSVTASYGAIGKSTVSQTKDFATSDEADKYFSKTEADNFLTQERLRGCKRSKPTKRISAVAVPASKLEVEQAADFQREAEIALRQAEEARLAQVTKRYADEADFPGGPTAYGQMLFAEATLEINRLKSLPYGLRTGGFIWKGFSYYCRGSNFQPLMGDRRVSCDGRVTVQGTALVSSLMESTMDMKSGMIVLVMGGLNWTTYGVRGSGRVPPTPTPLPARG